MTATELVQRYCAIAVGADVQFRFQFIPHAGLFDVVNEADLEEAIVAAKDDPEAEGIGVPLLASFYIGDDAPSMSDLSTEGPLFDAVRAKMQTLHTLLEG